MRGIIPISSDYALTKPLVIAVLQRVKSASVTVDGKLISSIGRGLLVLAAISKDDTEKDVQSMAGKILKAKLWDDEATDPPGRVSLRAFSCLADKD